MNSKDTFRLLVEDDDMDLVLEDEQHMYALLEETYGQTSGEDRQVVRTNRGGGWRRVQRFMYDSEVQCYDILRMKQETFQSLCKILSEKYQLEESCNVYLEESVAMSTQYWPYFKDCIGALDGTHVSVRPPSGNVEPYRGRKSEATMNVLAICNLSMRFIYAYVGVPGRAHDTKVLTYCAQHEAAFPHPPLGKYYLVDSGYPTRNGYLGPHRRTRYHLDQFNRGGPPTNSRELFNRKHSGLRSVIERTFGVWKAKWRILDRKHPKYELNKWMKIVTATMALHNFIRDSQQEDRDFQHWERVDSYEHHGDGDGDHNHDQNHVPYIPAGDRFMEHFRDTITMEMANGTRLPY